MNIDRFLKSWTSFIPVALMVAAVPSYGLTMPGSLVYSENYDLETSFPLSPEVDTIGGGGGSVIASPGNGSPSATFNAGQIDVALSGTPGPAASEQLAIGFGNSVVGAGDFGARGFFDSFSLTPTGEGLAAASVAAVYADAVVSASLFHARTLFQGTLLDFVGLAVLEVDPTTGMEVGGVNVFMPAVDVATFLGSGAGFRLDLVVDRSAGTAIGELVIDGGGVYTSSALSLALTSGGLLSAGQFATLQNVSYGSDDSMLVSFDSFEGYSPIPEPSTAILLALGLFVMGQKKDRRRD